MGHKKIEPKTYVVTSAQASYEIKREGDEEYYIRNGGVAKVHPQFLKGLERYCMEKDSELIILPMNGKNARETIFHESLDGIDLFKGELNLNSNIKISNMKVPPQNIDPTTGRIRFAQRDRTLIYAHPKQRFRAVPSSNWKLPKLLLTTGSITTPNYNTENHRGDVARRDHTLGAIVIEVFDDQHYNVRHITANKKGDFIDLGKKYRGDKNSINAKADSLVFGDLHVGDTDEMTRMANYEMIEYFKPKRLILHDVFNGHSINPHEKDSRMSRVRAWGKGRLCLEDELQECREELVNLSNASKGEIYIAKSNHDIFLDRYLERGDFLKEPWNAEISLKISYRMSKGKDPFEEGINLVGGVPKNVHFLNLRSDLKRWGYQLASHGHKGNSGARRSSVISRETAHGKSITGHSHTPEILRNTYIVGTSTRLDLPYTDGSASSWMAANAILYEGGQVQLIPIINGIWKR